MFIDGTVIYTRRPTRAVKRTAATAAKKKGQAYGWTFEVAVRRYDGLIVWVSGPYPSRRNDIAIVRASGILDQVDQGERIVGDRGYVAADLAHILLTPAKKPPNGQLSMAALARNAELNLERSLVEHVFGRMKVWQVLGKHWRGHNRADLQAVFVVCAHLFNFVMRWKPIHKQPNI